MNLEMETEAAYRGVGGGVGRGERRDENLGPN